MATGNPLSDSETYTPGKFTSLNNHHDIINVIGQVDHALGTNIEKHDFTESYVYQITNEMLWAPNGSSSAALLALTTPPVSITETSVGEAVLSALTAAMEVDAVSKKLSITGTVGADFVRISESEGSLLVTVHGNARMVSYVLRESTQACPRCLATVRFAIALSEKTANFCGSAAQPTWIGAVAANHYTPHGCNSGLTAAHYCFGALFARNCP